MIQLFIKGTKYDLITYFSTFVCPIQFFYGNLLQGFCDVSKVTIDFCNSEKPFAKSTKDLEILEL